MARLLFLMSAVLALMLPQSAAAVCCPAGSVQDGGKCVTTGYPPLPTNPVECRKVNGGRDSPGRRPTTGSGGGPDIRVASQCCNPAVPPRGSFGRTCRNVEMRCLNEAEMFAICRKRNGSEMRSSMLNPQTCRSVENDNGQLRCKGRTSSRPAAC